MIVIITIAVCCVCFYVGYRFGLMVAATSVGNFLAAAGSIIEFDNNRKGFVCKKCRVSISALGYQKEPEGIVCSSCGAFAEMAR